MTPETDDLVKRLRAQEHILCCAQAADLIQHLVDPMSNRNRDQQPIPQPPRKPVMLNASVIFHTSKGDIALDWDATTGDVTHAGDLVHNTNDLGLLHTVAKGILAAKREAS
jgi:hypothetical protein